MREKYQDGFLDPPDFRDPQEAFTDAINAGVLSSDMELRGTELYVGSWMYMYSKDGYDYFKNIAYRHYITSKIPERV